MKCSNCGLTDERFLLQHHVSYVPEKVITLCWACHKDVHSGRKGKRERSCHRQQTNKSRLQKLQEAKVTLTKALWNLKALEESFFREEVHFQKMLDMSMSSFWADLMERAGEIADRCSEIRDKLGHLLELIDEVTDWVRNYNISMPHENIKLGKL